MENKYEVSYAKDFRLMLTTSLLVALVFQLSSVITNLERTSLFPSKLPIISFIFLSITLVGCIFYIGKRWEIFFSEIFPTAIILVFVSIVFWTFAPSSIKVIKPNYYTVFEKSENDAYILSSYSGYLYSKDDIEAQKTISYLKNNEENNMSRRRSFIFWQTSLMYGVTPSRIEGIDVKKLYSNKFTLFFSSGLMSIFEVLLRAVTIQLPACIILFSLFYFSEYRREGYLRPIFGRE